MDEEMVNRHEPGSSAVARSTDPAGESLANALRVSFRLLSVLMLVVLFFYLLTGVKSIEPYQVGIKTRFGKIIGVAEEGLAYTWPFPIGQIEIIDTKEQRLTIDDFWMREKPEDKTKELLERSSMAAGLVPGFDGALLTGDRNLLHVRLTCTYAVRQPREFKTYVAGEPVAGKGRGSQKEVTDAVVRSSLCAAAIRAAAFRTADGLQRTERDEFALDVMEFAQEGLDALKTGIRINNVLLTDTTWPLRALPAYIAAQQAVSEAEKRKNAALAEAEKILNEAAGASYRALVGDLDRQAAQWTEGGDGLIGEYIKARRAGDEVLAEQLLARIDSVLLSNSTGGEASRIIAQAREYRTGVLERIKSRADKFNELLPGFLQTPELMLERLWASAREDILNAPSVEKFYLTTDRTPTVLRISRDPEVFKQIMREQLKAAKEKP